MRHSFSAVMLAIALFLSDCDDTSSQAGSRPPAAVTIATPLVDDIVEWDEYTGRFVAVTAVDIRARVSGYLQSVHFDEGGTVEKDQLLFVIDQRPFEAALDRAKANAKRAEARLAFTRVEVERAEPLLSRGNISKEEYDSRIQERNQASAELDAARADVRSAELDLEFTEVRAPVAGQIGEALVDIGNLVEGGQAGATLLTRLNSIDPIHFEFTGSEHDYLKYIRLSQTGERESSRTRANPVWVKLADEENFTHLGRMNFVDNRIDPQTGTIRAKAIFDNPDGFFTPGVLGRLLLWGSNPHRAVMIPDQAVLTDQSRKFVYVLGENNIPQRTPVTPGEIHRGLRVIKQGLEGTEKVLVNGLVFVRPGQPVSPETTDLEYSEPSLIPPERQSERSREGIN